jgi:hypothetical protein
MKFSFPVRVYILALALRLIPVILTRGMGIGLDDMFQYDMLARSLASGHGYRWYAHDDLQRLEQYVIFDLSTATGYDPNYGVYTSFRAPLYPAFLAVIYFFSGTSISRFFIARAVQAVILGAPLAPLTYYVAKRLSSIQNDLAQDNNERERKWERVGRISAYLAACYPMLILYPLVLSTENLFFSLLLASFLFILKSIERPSIFNFLLSGASLALTVLTRSLILPFATFAILYMIFLPGIRWIFGKNSNSGELRETSKVFSLNAIASGIVFVAIIAPWVIRNSLLHHKLTGVETSMGYNLYLGYHPQGNGSFVFGPSLDLLAILDDARRDEVGTQKAIVFIKEEPGRFLPLAINRLGFFFGLEKRGLMYFYSNNLLGYISKPVLLVIAVILLIPFAFVSFSAALSLPILRWNLQTALLLLLFVTYLLPHVLILSEDRFHLALIPFLAILAAQFWTGGFQAIVVRWHGSSMGKWSILMAVLFVLLLFLNWGFELSRDANEITALLGPNGNTTYFAY